MDSYCEAKVGIFKVPLGIELNDEYDTYEEFDNKLREESKRNFVQFWKRDCRTVEGAKKKTDRYINPKIKYYQLKYACVHGGRLVRKRDDIYSRKECEANFYLIATPDGCRLFVKSMNINHNHEVSEANFLKYFMEERVRRGRPRKKHVKEEIEEYSPEYLYEKFDLDVTDGDLKLGETHPTSLSDTLYEHLPQQNPSAEYDSGMCNQEPNVYVAKIDDNIDNFLKYLGSEIRQIKSQKVIKNLKRKFISMVQKAQDDEDSI